MSKIIKESLSLDDVLITPKYSEVKSRRDVDLSVSLSKGLNFKLPVSPSPMATIVNFKVANEMYKAGGLCLLHRFGPIQDQLDILGSMRANYKDSFDFIGITLGIQKEDYNNIKLFYDFGVRIFCVDIAHANSLNCIEMVKYISETYPDIFLIAGTIATPDAAVRLWANGADMVRVNCGAGSICTTRIQSGVGAPQFTALVDIYDVRENSPAFANKYILGDGGCNKIGDLVKSLCVADMVISGNLFSGSIDGPGKEIIIDGKIDGKKYKSYVGSSTHRKEYIEGVEALVEIKPPIKDILKGMMQGIASGCSYTGSFNLKELQKNAEFIKITHAGQIESGAHDVKVVK